MYRQLDFSGVRLLVVGDVMLDKYYFGSVNRISPEAPVPVVKVNTTKLTLGGAGNVVSNTSHLGAEVCVVGWCGKDNDADTLKALLKAVNSDFELQERDLPTVTKLRVIGDKQQIVRLDFEEIKPLDGDQLVHAHECILMELQKADAVILSDYGKGMCTPELTKFVIGHSVRAGKPVIVDPKGSDWSKYAGADIVTPNVKELAEVAGIEVENNDEDIELKAKAVLKQYGIKSLVVTRSEKGMSVITEGVVTHIPTEAREVFDVSGAGDTVVAALGVCLGKGFDMIKSVNIANIAAGIVVAKVGTAPVKIDELRNIKEEGSEVLTWDKLDILEDLKTKGKKIVFTNGCFDILHRGHLTYLREARKLGDILVVGLNSDRSVRELKGTNRPVNNENDRAEMLRSLEFVDFVVIFDQDTPFELLSIIKPDVLVKGGDYKPEEIVGRELAGKTIVLNFVDGYSTTSVIEKMKES